jgi:glycosyltransferase involved in cell wall biosynthesis
MADNEPLVSVGIPAYNRPEGLKKTLESITGQTYRNLEIIVSDNCSPDPNVERIAKDFEKLDNRIQYFRQTENTGAANNFRFVLGKARGEYFMWAADDDFISEDFIWQAVRFFKEHSGYAIVSGIPFNVTRRGEHRANNGHSFTGKFGVLRVLQTYNARGMVVVYGLINTITLRRIIIGNRFAEDRYIVASLAYMGKVKTLETMKLYRIFIGQDRARNISDMHRRMVESGGIKFRGVALARLMMATNASKDIFVQKEVYRGLSFPAKVLLAPCCFVVSIYNSIKIFYVERYIRRPVHMAGKRIRGSLRFKNDSKRESELVKDSVSYQLGSAIVQALHKPGRNTILLPYRVVWLCVVGFKKRKARVTKGTTREAEKGQTDQLTSARWTRAYTEKELEVVKNSFSYRLGNILVQAIYRPGRNTILLPYRLFRLCVGEFRKWKIMAAPKGSGAN